MTIRLVSELPKTKPSRGEEEAQAQAMNEPNEGLTLKPVIDGEYYREYTTCLYISPVILFPNILTQADKLKVDYYFPKAFFVSCSFLYHS